MSTGPFVVRHERLPEKDGATGWVLSVKAVADLSAAHDFIGEIINGRPELTEGMSPYDLMHIGESGGTVKRAEKPAGLTLTGEMDLALEILDGAQSDASLSEADRSAMQEATATLREIRDGVAVAEGYPDPASGDAAGEAVSR